MTTTDPTTQPPEPEPTMVVLPSLDADEPRELLVPLNGELLVIREATE